MEIEKVWKHPDVHGLSWINQYQYTNASINLPGLKWLGISKRQWEVSIDHLYTQVNGIQWEYADINWITPYNRGWSNMRSYGTHISQPWSGTVQPGQSQIVDVSNGNVTTAKIVGLAYPYTGGYPGGTGVNVTIPENGKVRFQIYNNTGAAVTFSGGNLEARIMASVQEAVDYLGQMRDGHVGMSQITEDGMPFAQIEQIMRGTYNREKARRPTLTMEQWNQFYDYFAHINHYSNECEINRAIEFGAARQMLSSEDMARRIPTVHPNAPDTLETSTYFTQNCWEYRHRGTNGYLGGFYYLKNGYRTYDLLFNNQKQYAAMEDRQVLVYGTILGEGIDNACERRGCWPRLAIPDPEGDIIRCQFTTFGFSMFVNDVYLTLLSAEKFVTWDDNGLNGQDIRNWGVGYYGGFEPEKTQWQRKGEGIVVWNNSNPSHPHPIDTPGNMAAVVRAGENGIFTGAWAYDQTKNYCNTYVRCAKFNYTDQDGAHAGYQTTDTPKNGERGNPDLQTYKHRNLGQDNIVTSYENDLAVCLEGKGDSGHVVYFHNSKAGPDEESVINITLSNTTSGGVATGQQIQLKHKGCGPGIWKIRL